jgi:MFS family permease
MEKSSKTKFYIVLVIFSLIGQVAWVVENMYFNVFIYEMFQATPKDITNMVMASAITATLTTLIVGALSDKLGKRKIFMSLGYILWGVSILTFAFIRKDIVGAIIPASVVATSTVCITLVIIMDCAMTFFGSSANDACFNAWLTDVATSENRGKAEGINSMMPLMAILVVFGGFMGLDTSKESSWVIIYSIIGIVVIAIGILGFFIIEEPKIETDKNKSYFKNIIYGFRPSVIKENKGLYIYLIAFAIFGISIQIFMPYLIIYYEHTLEMQNYVFIMAPAIILAGIFTFFWGKYYDKVGFNKSIFPSLGLLALGYIFLIAFTSSALVFIGSLAMMCGYLSGMAVFGAKIRDKIPENKSGMFQGLRIIGQVLIPGIIGPAIGNMVLNGAEKKLINGQETFIPNIKIFIAALVVLAFAILTVLLIIFLKSKRAKNEAK